MKELADKAIKGRALYVSGNLLMVSLQDKLLQSLDGGNHWEETFTFNGLGIFDSLKMKSYHLSRLFRFGVHHLTRNNSESWGIIFNKKLAVIKKGKMKMLSSLPHSRPLSFESCKNNFLFGEYRNNSERSSVGVYSFSKKGNLKSPFQFEKIRHIHGVYKDPYSDSLWITTGDNDDEAAIYRSSTNFKSVEKILGGSQQTRTIKLLFHENYVVYGSDAPEQVNYIYRFDRATKKVEKLQEVGSTVFHGCQVANWFFFSTAIEHSSVNKTKHAEIWASPDGEKWGCILKLKKDFFPMKLFQYGQIFFPNNPGETDSLWFSPFATEYGNWSFKMSISTVKKLYDKSIS